jgi:multidrug resistance efflux pump
MKRAAIALAAAAFLAGRSAAQEPAKNPEPGSFEIEPPLLPGNLEEPAKSEPLNDVSQLERKLGRARENAAGAERLFRIGALAKAEAENRGFRVIKLEADLARARLAAAQSDNAAGAGTLAQLQGAAQLAAEKEQRAELELATTNLDRQRKLLALGSGGKSTLRKAEEKLAELQRARQ